MRPTQCSTYSSHHMHSETTHVLSSPPSSNFNHDRLQASYLTMTPPARKKLSASGAIAMRARLTMMSIFFNNGDNTEKEEEDDKDEDDDEDEETTDEPPAKRHRRDLDWI